MSSDKTAGSSETPKGKSPARKQASRRRTASGQAQSTEAIEKSDEPHAASEQLLKAGEAATLNVAPEMIIPEVRSQLCFSTPTQLPILEVLALALGIGILCGMLVKKR
jgi:hypothetical protein